MFRTNRMIDWLIDWLIDYRSFREYFTHIELLWYFTHIELLWYFTNIEPLWYFTHIEPLWYFTHIDLLCRWANLGLCSASVVVVLSEGPPCYVSLYDKPEVLRTYSNPISACVRERNTIKRSMDHTYTCTCTSLLKNEFK